MKEGGHMMDITEISVIIHRALQAGYIYQRVDFDADSENRLVFLKDGKEVRFRSWSQLLNTLPTTR